jgi:hypothetical protein
MFAMAAPLPLRPDVDAAAVRREERRARDAAQARRLLALAAIADGGTRGEAAKMGGVTLQIVRRGGSGNCPLNSFPDERAVRFNGEGPAGPAVEPHFPVLRRHPRSCLRRLAAHRRSAMAHHDHRHLAVVHALHAAMVHLGEGECAGPEGSDDGGDHRDPAHDGGLPCDEGRVLQFIGGRGVSSRGKVTWAFTAARRAAAARWR